MTHFSLTKTGILSPGLVIICFFLLASWTPTASLADTPPSAEQRLALLDFEILLLRTEIALRNGERGRFLVNMHALSSQSVAPQFQARFDYLSRQREMLDIEQVAQSQFRTAMTARDIVVLLPLSSDIADVSRAMLEEFEQGLPDRRIHAIDTDLYDDMVELSKLVNLFNPGLIIGPMQRQKAEQFFAQNPQVPSIGFTRLDVEQPYLRTLASGSLSQINYLQPLLENLEPKNLAWLTDRSAQAEQLMQQVIAAYQRLGVAESQIQRYYLEEGVDKSVSTMLGVGQSMVRQNWLQATLGRVLETQPYVRSDNKLVIGIMPQTSAIQLKPLLNFYQTSMPFIWLPSQVPAAENFANRLASWQSTFALFPAHITQNLTNTHEMIDENPEVGLFRAMAKALIKLVETADTPLPYQIDTPMGMMKVNELGHYQFMPSMIELNQGKLKNSSLEQLNIHP
jgi:hypothetical protein